MGKTEIAVALAESLDAEIVSADSMQVYRGLPIVTNQPSAEQLARVPHHLVGTIDPRDEFSAARYAELAEAAIDDVLRPRASRRGDRRLGAVPAGGAGRPQLRRAARRRPQARLEALATADPGDLRERLLRADPAGYAAVDLHNPRRVLRALETLEEGAPAPRHELWSLAGLPPHVAAGASTSIASELRQRVDDRVDEMAGRGLLDEIAGRRGRCRGPSPRRSACARCWPCWPASLPSTPPSTRMKARTRGYVRRQLTWMRKLNADIIPTSARPPESVARDIARRLS